ncbi:putative mannosyl-oligosaccharide alpha-1,2-mannosidase 1B [Leucoagaricus sp. SymC.cos]|nr:putative mannosyl-oligosaccharide alpha-1,2-mannosidase 1B [Leucoagaricus sp. SymC.cos]
MIPYFAKTCAVFLTVTSILIVSAGKVQKDEIVLPSAAAERRAEVKDMFVKSYEAYRKHAWGHDDLAPRSQSELHTASRWKRDTHTKSILTGYVDSRNGWGASVVDGMSTMLIMDLDDYFNEAVNFTSKIDFSRSKTYGTVSVFETTIRYLGGLLSAYELSGEKFPVLVAKAKEVADKMSFAWVGKNDIPFGHLDFATNRPQISTTNIAEAGTLLMEWGTLSKYTGDDKYRQLAEKAMHRIATNPSPLPGLAAQGIDPSIGSPVGGYVTWGGGSDSYFEYLIKYTRLNDTADPLLADTWKVAVDSSIRTLLKRSVYGNQTYLADYDGLKHIVHISSHLACFHGGNWLLGGRMLNNQTIVDIALQLVDSCWNTYASTATGIGPEVFAFTSDDGTYTGRAPPSRADQEFNKAHGFYIDTSSYILRPEVLESNFYAWRVTGDTKYFDRAASAVQSFQKHLPVKDAYAGIWNVDVVPTVKYDHMESFWFAEVLKYLYLTFEDPTRFSLDEYVFNTEAQPLKAPPPKETYGSATGLIVPENPLPFVPIDAPTPTYSQSPTLPPSVLCNTGDILKGFLAAALRLVGFYF